MSERKPWPCGCQLDDGGVCEKQLGYIVGGELITENLVNTDGVNLIILCPGCGRPKVWYPQPQKILAAAGRALANELAIQLAKRAR